MDITLLHQKRFEDLLPGFGEHSKAEGEMVFRLWSLVTKTSQSGAMPILGDDNDGS